MGANPRRVLLSGCVLIVFLWSCHGVVRLWSPVNARWKRWLLWWPVQPVGRWKNMVESWWIKFWSQRHCTDLSSSFFQVEIFVQCGLKPSVSANLACKSTNLLEIDPPKSKRMTPSLNQFVWQLKIYREAPSVNIQQALRKHKVILNFPLFVRGLGGYCSHNLSEMIFNVFSQV